MNWNRDMATAPKGEMETTTRTVKGKDGPIQKEYKEHRPAPIWLLTKCKKVIQTYWVPNRSQWAGLATGEDPVAWQPFVKPEVPEWLA